MIFLFGKEESNKNKDISSRSLIFKVGFNFIRRENLRSNFFLPYWLYL